MSRQIKFRGMSERGFVYGDLLSNCNGKNGPYVAIKDTVSHINDSYIDIIPTAVKPETVGQFTGLLDKNGKEIFEGDIVTACHDNIKGYKDSMVVEYHQCNFCLRQPGDEIFNFWLGSKRLCNIEIIGNIHTTPELLA